MKAYWVNGGRPLEGTVAIHGAKNSVLPILAACICCAGICEIENCPRIADVDTAIAILEHLGCRVVRQDHRLMVDATTVERCDIPGDLMSGMRSSILFLGALLTRCGRAELSLPGGCALGRRPIDLHLWAAEELGACWEGCSPSLHCTCRSMTGCCLPLRCPSVGATENAMLMALGCRGVTTIENAAREPEITDLARFLTAVGAKVVGAGTGTITVEGGRPLHGACYKVMADRIEAATYLCAAAGCGGRVELVGAEPDALLPVTELLERSGCILRPTEQGLLLQSDGRLHTPGPVVTRPHPGFPTDAQAPMMAALLRAAGITEFTETIFENRLRHVEQLRRLGADIRQYGSRALVRGVPHLHGGVLEATDLRCGAALLIGALQAEGDSTVLGVHHIRRGYDNIAETLRAVGARIWETDYTG